MRKLILRMSVSLDGFVGGPNGEIDWIFGNMSDDATAWTVDTLRQVGVHIMGRRTFYDMAAYWPTATEPYAAPMNEIPKVVFARKGSVDLGNPDVTTSLKDARHHREAEGSKPSPTPSPNAATWEQALVAGGDLAEEIARLKQQPGKDILAHGGASFAQSLVKQGLIDEYRLLVHPVALGTGLPLFSKLSEPVSLKLSSTTAFSAGAIAQVYRPA